MATKTQKTPERKEMYVGEKFVVWVIRRDWSFWTGTRWVLGPYDAKLFSQKEKAEKYIKRRQVIDENFRHDPKRPITVRECVLEHK